MKQLIIMLLTWAFLAYALWRTGDSIWAGITRGGFRIGRRHLVGWRADLAYFLLLMFSWTFAFAIVALFLVLTSQGVWDALRRHR